MTLSVRTSFAVVLLALASGCASGPWAGSKAPSKADAATQTTPAQGAKTVRGMFGWADKNNNGQLTREEAKGHLPITYSSFDSIDTEKRGWISFDQFLAFTNKRVGKQAEDIMKIGEPL